MQEINLLQTKVRDNTSVWQRQSKLFLISLCITLVLIAGGAAGLFVLNKKSDVEITSLTQENQKLQADLSERYSNLENAKAFQAQLANLASLLENHVYISPLLEELGRLTYINSQFMTLTLNEKDTIHIEGIATTYNDLAKMLLGLSGSDYFTKVKLTSISTSLGEVNAYNFAVDVTLNTQIFSKK